MNNIFKKRIDELGRIVIPKQIRSSINLKNFDEIEMFTDNDSIVLKKSVGIEKYKNKFERLLNLLYSLLAIQIIITDKNNNIILCSSVFDYGVIEMDKLSNSKNNNIEFLPIIVDSNHLGNIYFINNHVMNLDKNILKNIRDIFIDLIN